MQAMMYIANFSERTVDVAVEDEGTPAPAETPVPATTPEKTPGFGLAIGAAGAGLAYLRRKY